MPAPDPNTRAHLEWPGFIQPNGLVVSAPALANAGAVLNRQDAEGQRRLAECLRERELDPKRGPESCIPDFGEFATAVLGWGFLPQGYAGTEEVPIPDELELLLPEYGETLRPDFAVRERDRREGGPSWQLLVQVLDAGRDFDAPATGGAGPHLEASPHGRAERLLRGTGVPAGLLFNGVALRLISAPRGESSGWMDFRVADMTRTAGRPLCSALRLLLSEQRLLALPRNQRLAAILEESRKYQNEVTERLSEQVLHALYELVRGLQAAHDASGGALRREPLSADGDRNDIYHGLLSVIRGHVDDIDWYRFVHGPDDSCRGRLWLVERGTSGDLAEQVVQCECGKSRRMHEAVDYGNFPLGACRGARPWLGRHANEECREPSRLLIRTASNAWFPQVVSVLSLPDRGSEVDQAVEELWDRLQIVTDANALAVMKQFPDVANRLAPFSDAEVLDAIAARKSGGASGDRPMKHAELDALLSVPEGYGEDPPVHPDFHARRLPESVWRRSGRLDAVEAVTQVHRLREVLALAGFTRLEPVMPNVDGEYEAEVERADIALEPSWFPAVENRGEGILLRLRAAAVMAWLGRDAVTERLDELVTGHNAWAVQRRSERPFPGGAYVLLHTLSHLLIQSLSMRCGYPAASIRERIFVDTPGERYALLLYTASPDAEGTLGGLVQEARRIEAHLQHALRAAALCSNDPVCADHVPGHSMEERWLHGAACHGCTLIAETSCEMRNEYLDRALVVPTLYAADVAFFGAR